MIDSVVQSQWTVEYGPGDLAAIRHLAKRRGVDGGRDLGRDRLNCRQDRHPRQCAETSLREEIAELKRRLSTGENQNVRLIRTKRKDLARTLTILSEQLSKETI